jgi:hypothetical protein
MKQGGLVLNYRLHLSYGCSTGITENRKFEFEFKLQI